MPYLGETCALATAVCWTGSALAFGLASRAVGPLPANHFRVVVAVPLLLLLAWLVTGACWPVDASAVRMRWLLASGVLGLVLGDLGFFYALATIGPRLSSVVMATWPAFTVGIDLLCGQAPSTALLFGIALTVLGVLLVLLRHREGSAWNPGVSRARWCLGIGGAVLGALGQAGGYVVAGFGMNPASDLPAGIHPLQATVVRMVTAAVGLQLVLTMHRRPLALAAVVRHAHARKAAMLGALLGPIGGVWLSMVARRETADNGVAAALMATSPIFMMPVAAVVYRARIGALGIFGTVLTVAGVAVCLLTR